MRNTEASSALHKGPCMCAPHRRADDTPQSFLIFFHCWVIFVLLFFKKQQKNPDGAEQKNILFTGHTPNNDTYTNKIQNSMGEEQSEFIFPLSQGVEEATYCITMKYDS